jgi:ATP-binding cassette, subfamily F, member 3
MISVENLSLQFTGQRIFEDISFMIGSKDKVGLVGKNGAGKSTLLKIIHGEQQPDSGQIVKPQDVSIGYLPQQLIYHDNKNVLDEALSAFDELNKLEKEIEHLNIQLTEREDYESDSYLELVEIVAEKNDRISVLNSGNSEALAEQTLLGLGFERNDFERPTKEFSGGWRMRIELAKILLRSPDIFLLDEPTNHLDIESIQWLENFLAGYRGAVLLISHDRTFLDRVTKRTIEISLGKIHDYKVPYTAYLEQRKERREQLLAAYRNQQKQIEETEEFIERFRYKATKAVQVQSRIKQLQRIERIEVDEEDLSSINIKFPSAPRSGTIVFEAENLSKSYGALKVLDEISLYVERGEKIAFVGRNGEGKTTLSRIIIREIEAEGLYKLGHNVNIGYFAQNQDELLNPDKTVFETIDDIAVGDVRAKIRDILGAFLFSGEDIDKKVRILSGGEKSRLSIAKLLLEPYNLLVLDEPTNHLDLRSKDILKQALESYNGTVILVSHDRDFLNGLTDRILEFRNKKIKEFRGTIREFLKKKQLSNLDQLNLKTKNRPLTEEPGSESYNKQLYSQRKEFEKKKRKIERKIGQIETEIENLESRQADIEKSLAKGISDQELLAEYENNKKQIKTFMLNWEKEHAKLDALGNESI